MAETPQCAFCPAAAVRQGRVAGSSGSYVPLCASGQCAEKLMVFQPVGAATAPLSSSYRLGPGVWIKRKGTWVQPGPDAVMLDRNGRRDVGYRDREAFVHKAIERIEALTPGGEARHLFYQSKFDTDPYDTVVYVYADVKGFVRIYSSLLNSTMGFYEVDVPEKESEYGVFGEIVVVP